MKPIILALALLGSGSLQASTLSDCFVNLGTVTNFTEVNAPCFLNQGLFSVSSDLLFDFQNVLNFTNRADMQGVPGFRIDYVNDSGKRTMMDNFINNGSISSTFPTFFFGGGAGGNGISLGLVLGGFFSPAIMISAQNLVNRGQLQTSDGGLIRINGGNVDLTRGSLGVLPIQSTGFNIRTPTNFFPEAGIFDNYWGIRVDDTSRLVPGSVVTINGRNVNVSSGPHIVTNASSGFGPAFGQQTSLSLRNPASFIFTNKLSETNWLVQGAFVSVIDTNISISARFAPSPIITNDYKTVVIQLASQETNVLQGGHFLTTLYIIDRLVSDTNYNVLTNLSTLIASQPAPYEIRRATPLDFSIGSDSNAVLTPDLFYNNTQSNRVVTNSYAAYGFSVGSSASFVAPVPNASLTNSPGRIEIVATNLTLDRTRLRGQSIVTVKTDNLVSSSNAVLDVQNLHLNLASVEGNLRVQSLAKPFVERTQGDIRLWSGSWTNETGSISTNVMPDPMDPTMMVTNMVTNVIDIGYHILMVDSRALTTHQPVFTDTFHARSSNVTISDIINVTSNLLVEADNLTIEGQLVLGDNVHDWTDLNFPGLTVLSNLGNIFIAGTGNYGCDRPDPYARIINRGTNTAFSHFICADTFENSGRMETAQISTGGLVPVTQPNVGTIQLFANSAKLEGGQFVAGGDVRLAGGDIKIRNYVTQAGKALILSVTNTLEDSGGDANNTFSMNDGFQLLVKPAFGDLLGSSFHSVAPKFQEVRHFWAGEDRGATKAGFSNNAAIGRLVLTDDVDTLHRFSGTGSANGLDVELDGYSHGHPQTGNGLYVDFLELSAGIQNDLAGTIQIDPNLTIYFADANVPVEDLDGELGGRLRWVKEFAGPNSSVDVALSSGRTVKVNRGLRQSRIIDSDADGVANAFDLDPFSGIRIAKIEVTRATPSNALISFEAAANTTYILEFTTTLFPPSWQFLSTFVNDSDSNRVVTLTDTVPSTAKQRYYRVRYNLP